MPAAKAPNFSNARLLSTKCQYPRSENGASPLPPACGSVATATEARVTSVKCRVSTLISKVLDLANGPRKIASP